MRTITLEEHFATLSFIKGPGHYLLGMDKLVAQLCDVGEQRMAGMDAAGIDVQVISLTTPGTEQLNVEDGKFWAGTTNDSLAKAVNRYPDRFAGFAALPMLDPEAAAEELSRMVESHGFVGAVINGHIGGRYLDDVFFWPVLARAEKLGVPIYLHPTPPPQKVIEGSYIGNFSEPVTRVLASGAWGWHMETAVHLLRIILSGAFDRFPQLQVMIGHFGEGLSFMMPRIEQVFDHPMGAKTGLERTIGEYLRQNVYYTSSGFNFESCLNNLMVQVPTDRIMFSTDYPFIPVLESRQFLDRLSLKREDLERIAHRNAEDLLGHRLKSE